MDCQQASQRPLDPLGFEITGEGPTLLEFSLNRIADADDVHTSMSIGIIQIDDTDPSTPPAILQPLDGHSLAVLLKVLNDIDAAQAAAREAWA